MIENIKKFCEVYPQVSDLVETAYSVSFERGGSVRIQGGFKADLVRKYFQGAAWRVNSANGFVDGQIKVDGLSIGITLT